MTWKLVPLGSRVLVRLKPARSQSSIILLPNQRQAAREAEVIATGPEVRDCQVGQIVIVNALTGQQVGEEIILPESAVLGFAA
jgi:co-chaperonin GroES (HSP10)